MAFALRLSFSRFRMSSRVLGECFQRQDLSHIQNCSRCTENTSPQDFVTEVEIDEEEAIKRDVSRLPKHLRNQMDHVLCYPYENQDEQLQTRDHKRNIYARYGKASGITANIMWPSKAELAETIEDEAEWEPTLQERWAKLEKQRQEEEEEIRKREALVETQMAKMDEYIEQFRKKLAKAEEAESQADAKRKLLLEEAREYFGYAIETHDPRYEKMKEEKEEREKLEKKKRRKAEKEAKLHQVLKSLKEEADKEKAAALKPETQTVAKESPES